MERIGKGGAHQLAGVVIAGNAGERELQRRKQPLEIVVFLPIRRIGEIARDHDEIGCRSESIQRCDTAFQRFRGIDLAVGQRARRLDMQVGYLGDGDGFRCHRYKSSSGNRRTASGAIDRPTRSPALACTVLVTSTASGFLGNPLTINRCRSPLKLTLSTVPLRAVPPASARWIDSGRTMATATARLTWLVIGCRPPGSTRHPFSTEASMMLAAPMNSA